MHTYCKCNYCVHTDPDAPYLGPKVNWTDLNTINQLKSMIVVSCAWSGKSLRNTALNQHCFLFFFVTVILLTKIDRQKGTQLNYTTVTGCNTIPVSALDEVFMSCCCAPLCHNYMVSILICHSSKGFICLEKSEKLSPQKKKKKPITFNNEECYHRPQH